MKKIDGSRFLIVDYRKIVLKTGGCYHRPPTREQDAMPMSKEGEEIVSLLHGIAKDVDALNDRNKALSAKVDDMDNRSKAMSAKVDDMDNRITDLRLEVEKSETRKIWRTIGVSFGIAVGIVTGSAGMIAGVLGVFRFFFSGAP